MLEVGPDGYTDPISTANQAFDSAIELDVESVDYLKTNFNKLEPNLVFGDFQKQFGQRFSKPFGNHWKFSIQYIISNLV